MTTITNPNAIHLLQLSAQIRVVKLEKSGMRRSGQSLSAQLKVHHGLKPRASYEKLLEVLEANFKKEEQKLGVSA